MLAQGLFDHMNAERSQVISGIGRYARGQAETGREAAQGGVRARRMRAQAGRRHRQGRRQLTDRLNWETRIFEERVQSLTYRLRGADADRAAALCAGEDGAEKRLKR